MLEITEDAAAEGHAARKAALELKRLGIGIALDDFGTGHSSLSQLEHPPVDLLKLDRTFVANLAEDGRKPALVRGVTDIARALDLSIVAEGVETHAQLAALAGTGCDCAQGYLFSMPLSSVGAVALLRGEMDPPERSPRSRLPVGLGMRCRGWSPDPRARWNGDPNPAIGMEKRGLVSRLRLAIRTRGTPGRRARHDPVAMPGLRVYPNIARLSAMAAQDRGRFARKRGMKLRFVVSPVRTRVPRPLLPAVGRELSASSVGARASRSGGFPVVRRVEGGG